MPQDRRGRWGPGKEDSDSEVGGSVEGAEGARAQCEGPDVAGPPAEAAEGTANLKVQSGAGPGHSSSCSTRDGMGVGMGQRFQNLSSCPCDSKHTDMHKAYLSF